MGKLRAKGESMQNKERSIDNIFSQIAGTPDPVSKIVQPGTGIAEPGDLLFFIDHYPEKTLRSEVLSNSF